MAYGEIFYYHIKPEVLDAVKKAMRDIPQKLRFRAMRNALSAGARLVRDTAKAKAPVLNPSGWKRKRGSIYSPRYRKPGTLRNAITVRTSKKFRNANWVGVFVGVRPLRNTPKNIAKLGRAGARNPNDPFYWSFQNYGWNPASSASGGRLSSAGKRYRRKLSKESVATFQHVGGKNFIRAGANMLPRALEVILAKLKPAFEKINRGQTP